MVTAGRRGDRRGAVVIAGWIRLVIALPVAAFHIYYFGWGDSPSTIPFIPTLRNEFLEPPTQTREL